jgi:tRNA1(Val) A37 N6-methylase TrmN6
LRLDTTDIEAFEQIFVRFDYESSNLPVSAGVILDLGANVGLATVFFGIRYTDAKLLAVEPSESNFAAMVHKTIALAIASQGDRWRCG